MSDTPTPTDPAPTDPAPATDLAPTDGTVTLTAEQVAEVTSMRDRLAKLEQNAANRPPATRDQLQAQLDEVLGLKNEGAEARKEGRDVADGAAELALDLQNKLRRTELVDAAKAAGFIDPDDAALALAGQKGNPEDLVKTLAATKPHWVRRTTEIDVTMPDGDQITDPGLKALTSQIAASRQ